MGTGISSFPYTRQAGASASPIRAHAWGGKVARALATSKTCSLGIRGRLGSTRPESARTRPARPSEPIAVFKNATRLCCGSTSVTRTSGRRSANPIAGAPAPEPTSRSDAPSGTK
jgi:hypothetical protein